MNQLFSTHHSRRIWLTLFLVVSLGVNAPAGIVPGCGDGASCCCRPVPSMTVASGDSTSAMGMDCCSSGDAPACDWSPGAGMSVTDHPVLAPKDDPPRPEYVPHAGTASALSNAGAATAFFKPFGPTGPIGPPIYLTNLTFLC